MHTHRYTLIYTMRIPDMHGVYLPIDKYNTFCLMFETRNNNTHLFFTPTLRSVKLKMAYQSDLGIKKTFLIIIPSFKQE
jgi:hypothetical protein